MAVARLRQKASSTTPIATMADGTRIGHAGYGGQYLMVDPQRGRVAAYLGVLENDSRYDEAFMARVVSSQQDLLSF